MADYCKISDIEAEIKNLELTASTVPTKTQVEGFISQESARIDSYISARYSLPVTGTSSLSMLKRICIALVAWRVSDIISTKKSHVLPNGLISQDTAGATAYKQAVKDLADIRDGKTKLPDETVSNSSAGKAYFASDNSDEDYEHTIEIGTKQW